MSYGYNPVEDVSVSAQMSDIPAGVRSSSAVRPIPCDQPRQYALNPTSGASASAGSIISFQIPPQANAFLKAGTIYLKMTVNIPTTVGGTGGNYGNSSQDCSSLFSRVSTFIGGQQLEIDQNYDHLTALLMTHTAGSAYGLNDFKIMTKLLGAGADVDFSAGDTASIQVMPLLSGWCNANQHFPLAMLKEPIVINFDVNTALRALKCAAGTPAFTITGLQLCYETIRMDNMYIQALREQVASGKLYSLNFLTPLGLQFAGAVGSTSYNAGLGLSSIRGIAIHPILTSREVATAVKAPSQNGLTNARFYIDGALVSNFDLSDSVQQYASLNNAFGNLASRSSCSTNLSGAGQVITRATYVSDCFAVGVGCEKFNEVGLQFAGSQCSNLQILIDGLTAAANQYTFIFHDTLLVLAADGSASVVR